MENYPLTNIIESTDSKSLKELVGEVRSGTNVLPDFQRDFVWEPSYIAQLLNSIKLGYPAGSILRMVFLQDQFSYRTFKHVSAKNENPDFLTLDGQQRLTSLHNAIHGVGTHKFFLNVKALIENDEFLDALFWKSNNSDRPIYFSKKNEKSENLPIPFSRLFDDSYEVWINETVETTLDESISKEENKPSKFAEAEKYRKLFKPIISAFNQYRFPVVCLKKNTSLEAICTIFETINNTGVKLSIFDLLTARFYPRKINLPKLWRKAKKTFSLFEEFSLDPVLILQTVSALTNDYKVERKDIMKLDANDFNSHWNNACTAFSEVLEMLQQDCGVMSKKWLPNSSILVTLSTVVCKFSSQSGPIVAENRSTLKKWFWRATIGLFYQNSPTSQIERDIPDLLDWIKHDKETHKIDQGNITQDFILQATPKQRAIYNTIMCAIVSNGIRDLYEDKVINANYLKDNKVNDHHVFPLKVLYEKDNKPYENRKKVPKEYDNIVNRILTGSITNKKIGSKSPKEYLGSINDKQKEDTRNRIWTSHLINSDALDAMMEEDYEKFRRIRVESIQQRLIELIL